MFQIGKKVVEVNQRSLLTGKIRQNVRLNLSIDKDLFLENPKMGEMVGSRTESSFSPRNLIVESSLSHMPWKLPIWHQPSPNYLQHGIKGVC